MDLSDLHWLFGSDSPNMAWWQMCLRAVVIFAFGIVLVRLSGQRSFGKLSTFDIVFSIMIGSNLSRALTGTAALLPTLAATSMLALLHFALGRLSIHNRPLGALIKGSPLQILHDGKLDEAAMRKGELSHGDFQEALRLHGLQDAGRLKSAYLERNGSVSIIKRE